MELPQAFIGLTGLSSEQLRQVLLDQARGETVSGVAALLLAARRTVPVEERLRWLVDSWGSARLGVKKYILAALGHCSSPDALAFLKERLCEPDLQLAAMASLADLGDPSIMPLCERFIRTGTEIQCIHAIGALRRLGSPDALSMLELAMRSRSTKKARLFAAQALACHGISSGEQLLERELFRLEHLLSRRRQSASDAEVLLMNRCVDIAFSLMHIGNKNALLAVRRMLDTGNSTDPSLQRLKAFTPAILKLDPSAAFVHWKTEMRRWIEEKLKNVDG